MNQHGAIPEQAPLAAEIAFDRIMEGVLSTTV
jgi:hypothetical protein